MGMLELDAPFRARDLPKVKAAWLHEHREPILDHYRTVHGSNPVKKLNVLHQIYINLNFISASAEV